MDYEVENTKRTLERLSHKQDPKNSPGENSENVFKSEVSPPGEVPYYKKKKIPKKLNGLDKYLIATFVILILFTIAVLIIFAFTGNEPTVLVGCFFGAFGGEVFLCARIKKYKLHNEAKIKGEQNDYGR